jgi:hypothetical protein
MSMKSVVLSPNQNAVVASLGFRRSLPLAWHVLPHAGSSNLPDLHSWLSDRSSCSCAWCIYGS